ncbi:MAG: hypothetical protein JXM79_03310 [Sedimentisphaerales bacterium]|nr:hypothetical protein [Sedimentisphaerales bacterium]
MLYKKYFLGCVLIASLISTTFAEKIDTPGSAPIEQTLEAVRNCMVRSPAPWPDEWKREYIETIRNAVESHQDATHYDERLEILREGFASCWEGLKRSKDRHRFEVYRCRMRWYVEHLMGTEFPTDQERQRLCDQYTDIWNYATNSLLVQFPFLDPNTVQKAKHEDLNVCYQKINAPLMPVYMYPMSEKQVAKIKKRWDKLRYARVDLFSRFGGSEITPSENGKMPSFNAEHDYQLTKESLSQLLGLVWMVVPQRPDYYLNAIENQNEMLKRRVQIRHQAHSNQQHFEKTRSRQLPQTEHISFLLTALLETPHHLERGSKHHHAEENLIETTE